MKKLMMFIRYCAFLLIVMIVLTRSFSFLKFSSHDYKVLDSVSECIMTPVLSRKNIIYSSRMSQSEIDNDDYLIANFMQTHAKTMRVINGSTGTKFQLYRSMLADHFIIVFKNVSDVAIIIDNLKNLPSWNPHGTFSIACLETFRNNINTAISTMKILWNFDVLKSVILLRSDAKSNTFDVYEWLPYGDGDCGINFNRTRLIDTCSFGITSYKNWYSDKLPEVFNDCRFIIRANNFEPSFFNLPNGSLLTNNSYLINHGLEGNMFGVIAEHLNLTLQIFYPKTKVSFGRVYNNGTKTGNLLFLRKGFGDIVSGHYSKFVRDYQLFDEGVFIRHESIQWCVSHQPKTRNLAKLLEILDLKLFTFLLVTFVTITILIWINRNKNEMKKFNSIRNCIWITFQLFLGSPLRKHARTTRVRYFMAMMMIWSFCLLTIYQTLLISALFNRGYVEEVRSVSDMLEKNFSINCYAIFDHRFRNDTEDPKLNQMNNLLLKKRHDCTQLQKNYCLVTKFPKNFAVCLERTRINYLLANNPGYKARPQFHCFKDDLFSFYINIFMRKGFPLGDKFNRISDGLLSAGLFNKWENDDSREEKFNDTDMQKDEKHSTSTFEYLEIIFIGWMGGCGMAIVTFICELFCIHIFP